MLIRLYTILWLEDETQTEQIQQKKYKHTTNCTIHMNNREICIQP